ncbi:cytochrome c biogenesis protein [Blattabacterium cuenoti]|uniref:cytochrome c biogenesis protein n=1 Tax=Blattabacterium cuenoti TaxID=1653831 RepID=UPI00163CF573|nr:cytochrome c biogenesis protein CcsA [Blattabacterium cuenoti]
MRTLKNIFFSTKMTSILFILLALSMSIATFVEKKYSTDIVKIFFYESTWFEILVFLFIINLIGNIWKYKLWKKKKIPLFIFHLSFVLIFIGGIFSRYYSFEGIMSIREGNTNNKIISRKNYIKLQANQNDYEMSYHDPYILSSFHYGYNGKFLFKGNIIKVKIIDYIPCAKEFISNKNPSEKIIKIISTNLIGREENYLKYGEKKKIRNIYFSLNKKIPLGIQIMEIKDKLYVKSSYSGEIMNMKNHKIFFFPKNVSIPLKIKHLYKINGSSMQWVFPEGIIRGKLKYIQSCDQKEDSEKKEAAITAIISFKNKSKLITFLGKKNKIEMSEPFSFNHLKISIGYGSILYNLPFSLRLNKFHVKNYPGSELPSFFISHVTLLDKEKKINYPIYMNHVLNYKGYRLFQSGYDPDKKGTHFSVNNDSLGTKISYIGYFFMSIGMFLTLFWKGTRFYHLKKKLRILSKISFFILFWISGYHFLFSNHHETFQKISLEEISDNIHISKKHGNNFSRLLVQDDKGRIKPVHTLALELLRKIHKKNHIGNLDANQWFISIHQDNIFWTKIPFIKVDKRGGFKFLNKVKANKDHYTSIMNLYKIKISKLKFVLQEDYEKAFSKEPFERNDYDKAVINLSERVGIIHGIFQGKYIRIFPIQNDPNHTWSSWIRSDSDQLNPKGLSMFHHYLQSLFYAQNEKDWNIANNEIRKIRLYQIKNAKSILPSEKKISMEILYNQLNIFYLLPFFYVFIGFFILFLSFIKIFYSNKLIFISSRILISILFLLFSIEFLALVLRWYISGHAPWSNGYESAIFLSWLLVGIGFLFYKNQFVSALSSLSSSILLFVSHGNFMDPEITNLVPVLKSYWLIIHVAIITSSYGFFFIGSFLGFLVLILYILKGSNIMINKKIQIHIDKLTIINEMSLTIGLFLLTIGTFLGSIWANSSWGRYWSWDPKETWALISIMVYAFVIHLRIIPGMKSQFLFNLSSIVAILSIIMTYFGVNYYLSGLHSYANNSGESSSFPYWFFYSILIFVTIIILSYSNYRKNSIRKK